ncbi:hypothetical protein ABIF20_003074 [Bradyrhizobium japonicum]
MAREQVIDGTSRRTEPISLRTPLALLLVSLGAIAAVWWWLATPITLARAPIDPADKVQCVSYAPFRGDQSPLNAWTHIEADQIEQDLRQLREITDCVRTYSMENAARPGAGDRRQGRWAEGAAGHLALQQPRQEF